MPPPPTPFHILRGHQAPISALHFTDTTLLAGDQDGHVSVTDLRARRVLSSWHAHDSGVLGLGTYAGGPVTQGRDNKLHFFAPVPITNRSGNTAAGSSTPPAIVRSLDCNALNFCAFSLLTLPSGKGKGKDSGVDVDALLALPNLGDSELIDIYHVPSLARIHAAINLVPRTKTDVRSGLVMGLELRVVAGKLVLVAGYEDGRTEVWTSAIGDVGTAWDARKSNKPLWARRWSGKCHNEAIMALAVDAKCSRAFTVSADHHLVRIDLSAILEDGAGDSTLAFHSTKSIGNACVAVSADGRVVAVGGWDGRIRLFSAASGKPLGTLAYHRESVQCIAFPGAEGAGAGSGGDQEVLEIGAGADDDSDDEDEDRARWMASGGKDTRVALWELMDFGGR